MCAEKVTTFNIYIGNLAEGTTDEDIRTIFEEYGTVVECNCLGKVAFVHMEDDIEGKHAVGELQDKELRGNKLSIQESKKIVPPKIPTVKLLVKNIGFSVDARGLRNMYKRFGFVLEAFVKDGQGYVCLEATGDIKSAINETNGFVIDDMALEVEPAPQSSSSSKGSPPKKLKPSTKDFGRAKSWTNDNYGFQESGHYPYPSEMHEDNFEYYDDFSGPNFYNGPPMPSHRPRPSHVHAGPPERILRDPHAHQQNHYPQPYQGGPRFRGPPPSSSFGHHGPRRGIAHHGQQMGGGISFMRPGIQHFAPPRREVLPRNPGVPIRNEEEVFYEDEPLSTSQSGRPNRGMSLSGSNLMPLGGRGRGRGGPQMRIRMPPPLMSSSLPGHRGFQRRGGTFTRGRGKLPKFTALGEGSVAPGEKYPVPPMHNPVFRAPLKWAKEDNQRKIKKKKKPLVPAELPDYSIPVPDLPKETVPRGAILKPFPAPFSTTHSQPTSSSSDRHIDFTADDVI